MESKGEVTESVVVPAMPSAPAIGTLRLTNPAGPKSSYSESAIKDESVTQYQVDSKSIGSNKDSNRKGSISQSQKTLYVFSQIFEKNDDIRTKPFVFEKHNLKKKKSFADYKHIKM